MRQGQACIGVGIEIAPLVFGNGFRVHGLVVVIGNVSRRLLLLKLLWRLLLAVIKVPPVSGKSVTQAIRVVQLCPAIGRGVV